MLLQSSDEEEVGEDGEKKKKKKEKKGLKEKIKDKLSGEKTEEVVKHEDTSVPVEKIESPPVVVTPEPEEKKGFLDKIKEKLPGGSKKPECEAAVEPPLPVAAPHHEDEASKEKKGLLEKIKEKLPGYSKSEEKDKEEPASH